MKPFHETLIDIPLEIGYQMGENGEAFATDSREAVNLIAQKAADFEQQHSRAQEDYLPRRARGGKGGLLRVEVGEGRAGVSLGWLG